MPFFGKWRRKDIYQNTEDRTPTTLTNYFLNVTLRHRLCSKSFVAIPEKGRRARADAANPARAARAAGLLRRTTSASRPARAGMDDGPG
jgi:hypothetical protein